MGRRQKLTWNVIYQNSNRDKIELWNIFNHGYFADDVLSAFKKYKNDKEEFFVETKRPSKYYYWSKCEWEVVLSNKNGKMIVTPLIEGNHKDISLDVTGDRVRSKMFVYPVDYEEIVDNADMMINNPSLILVQEPFLLNDELKEKATRWVQWANQADPSEYDPFAKKEGESDDLS